MDTAAIACPFCTTDTVPRQVPGLAGHFRFFDCPACGTEIKQPVARVVDKSADQASGAGPANECPDCAFSEFNCITCDDPVCEKHIRTFEKYRRFLSAEMGDDLISRYGNRMYCPLCFQNIFNRYSREMSSPSSSKKSERPRFFNMPLILGIAVLMLVLMLGVRSCDASRELGYDQQETSKRNN